MASSIMGSSNPAYAGMYAGLYSGIAKAQAFTGVPTGNIDGASLFMNNPNVAALKSYLSASQGQVETLQKQQGYMSTIANALNALGTLATTMNASYNFGGMQANSSDPNVVSAAAATNAKAGTAVVSVTNVALAQTNFSNAVSSATDAAAFNAAYGTGSLTIAAGTGATQTFTIANGTTLQSLANDINNNTASGVSASVVSTSGGYSLQLTGLQTGTANAVAYGETGSHLGVRSNVGQAAVDAQYTLNGQSLTSGSNTVSNALQGLTLQLNNASSTPQVINVAPNATEITNQVKAFVSAYNQVASAINGASNPNDPASLGNNAAVLNLQTALGNIAIVPSASATGTYSSLEDLGITGNADGSLSINNVMLQNAIANDPTSVESIFVTTNTGTKGVVDQMGDIANDYGGPGGILPSMANSIGAQLEGPDFGTRSRSALLASYQGTIASQYVHAQKAMAKLQAQNLLVQGLGR